MSAVEGVAGELSAPHRAAGGGVWHVYRAERRKLFSQLATRLLALVCLLGPFAFAGILSGQSGTPADTLLGVWVHTSGFAIPLVVLSFAGSWGFPVIAGILAGDIFSSEDRYGTWKTVLTRSCRRRDVFAGKVLATATLLVSLVVLAGAASLVAGLAFVGHQPLVGLGGAQLPAGRALALVVISWLVSILPALAFMSLAVLFSVATRNGIIGVLGPSLVALVMQLLALVGSGVWAHTLLAASAFDDWHGLWTAHQFFGPLAAGSLVSIAWTAACLCAGWLLLRRRDFAGTPVGRRGGWVVALRGVLVGAGVISLLAIGGNWGPAGVTAGRLEAALQPTFNSLTLLQQRELGRPVPAGAQLRVITSCNRRAGSKTGPGDDWVCTLNVLIPQPGAVPFQSTPVTYDMSVKSNGCYKAQAPPSFVGQQLMRDPHGRQIVNPLFTIYGCFNVL